VRRRVGVRPAARGIESERPAFASIASATGTPVASAEAHEASTPDLELSAEEQATWNGGDEAPGEVIPVEGTAPPSPFDPDWEGPDSGAPANTGEGAGGGGGGGGGTGGGGEPSGGGAGGPGKKPDRKECTPDMGHEACYACCEYNNEHVDGWECRKKKSAKAREPCWAKANDKLGECQRGCPPAVPPPPSPDRHLRVRP